MIGLAEQKWSLSFDILQKVSFLSFVVVNQSQSLFTYRQVAILFLHRQLFQNYIFYRLRIFKTVENWKALWINFHHWKMSGHPYLPSCQMQVLFSPNFYPDPDSCFFSIKLPTCHESNSDFRKAINTAISCQYEGYGRG